MTRAWNPKTETLRIVAAANDVVADATRRGYRFTLRRVFYELVGRNTIPNTERAYKNLSATLDRARWEGLMARDALDDLGRTTIVPASWESPSSLLEAAADQYRSRWWADAAALVEVWAEKQAVTSIVQPVADRWNVPFLACRGFSSLTALAEAADRLDRPTTVIYVGDHDPSGLDMDRDLQARMDGLGADIRLVRVALTPEQIEDYQLPPQPTKRADSRARGYSDEFDGSWELDALDADVLADVVDGELAALAPFDRELLEDNDREVGERIRELAALLEA